MGNCFRTGRKYSNKDSKLNFSGGNVHVVDSQEDWDEKILEANKDGKIVVANFSAAWCGPCRLITAFYTELSLKYPQLVFLTVDVDELMDLSTSFDIHATPTFFFLKDGQQIDRLVGANKPELAKKVLALAESSQSFNPTK
ncbi:thioredoxin H4-1 [Phalaenopsis equestris]|uniref:thioredoxin H4-1 n=1 Tax=Phalaenopsis equestris TaxID=78828 RepID=UPI0009E61513|nr:thioredoxin H4-1 [Phalaenopsis equestris]